MASFADPGLAALPCPASAGLTCDCCFGEKNWNGLGKKPENFGWFETKAFSFKFL